MFLIGSKKLIVASGVVLGVTGLGIFAGNFLSKKTISDNLGEVKLVSTKSNSNPFYLEKLFSKFFEKGKPKSKQFHKLFDILESKRTSNLSFVSDYKDVFPVWKKACEDSTKETYSSWFQKNDDSLLEDVKSACSLKISQIIIPERKTFNFSFENSYDEKEKATWKINLDLLKQRKTLDNGNTIYSVVFGGEQSNDSDEEENINKLYKWCRKNLNSYYTEESYVPIIAEMSCTSFTDK